MSSLATASERPECAVQRKKAAALRAVLASVGETSAEYRALMLKRIQEADVAVSTCERAVAEQDRAAAAQVEAENRDREAAAKKERENRFEIDELRSKAEFIRTAWSSYQCSYERERDSLRSNPFATPEQKEELRRTEAMLQRIRAAMKRGKLAQSSCLADEVAKLAFCSVEKSSVQECSQPPMLLMLRALKEIIASTQFAPSAPPVSREERPEPSEDSDMYILQPQFKEDPPMARP
jgi:hypothetical protein